MGLLSLEQAKGGPFVYQHEGAVLVLPDPRDMPLEAILNAVASDGRSLLPELRLPLWKLRALLQRWVAHYDLGAPREIERLAYLLDRYDDHVEYDLRIHAGGADLRELWQSRRWRLLLNLIDHLPRHSYYSEAVANDPEHAAMIARSRAEAEANGEEKKPYSPPMTIWTPEVGAIADLIDAVNGVKHVIQVVNSDPKGRKPQPPQAYPRPKTALQNAVQRAKHERRKKQHEALVKRLIRR